VSKIFVRKSYFLGSGEYITHYGSRNNRYLYEICSRCRKIHGEHSAKDNLCPSNGKIKMTRYEMIVDEN